MIRRETIQNILDAARIDEVVGDFVSLKKRGANLIGLCPFHNEKTPSFTVAPAKGFYHCFGCGKGGGPVDFVMEHEHLSYPDALRYLARKYNIDVREEIMSEEDLQAQSELETLYTVVSFAQKHFAENLFNSPQGLAIGMTYFAERGFNKETIRKFQLGYSPPEWDDLTKSALAQGYNITYLEKTGLSIAREGGGHYDRFRDRVIFPIHNLSGRVVGFTGRILTSDKSKPKYVNSPESDIYSKGRTLYGLFLAKPAIVQNDNCFLVEGNTDVISLFQAGIENVVASSGTALTVDQIRLIRKFTRNITILYDGDAAGIKASLRGIDLILEEGMNVKVVLFPDGEDPDSFIRKHDAMDARNYIRENASDFISFKTRLLYDEVKNDPIRRAELTKEIVRTISLIPEPIHRSIYLRECSSLMGVQEQSLINEMNKQLRKKFKKENPATAPETDAALSDPEPFVYEQPLITDPYDTVPHEKYLLWLLLNFGNIPLTTVEPEPGSGNKPEPVAAATYMSEILKAENFRFAEAIHQKIYDLFCSQLSETGKTEAAWFITQAEAEVRDSVISILREEYELSDNWSRKYKIFTPSHRDEDREILVRDISAVINAINARKVSKELGEIQEKIREGSQNEEDMLILLDRFRKRHALLVKINEKLGRIINT